MLSSKPTFSKKLLLVFSLASFAFVGMVNGQTAEIEAQSKTDKMISKTVSKAVAVLMQRDHLSSRKLDDTISNRAFDMFIKNLDPMKTYFLQSDIEEFGKWKNELDDQMLAGDFTAAFGVFGRFLYRVDERTDVALEMIEVDHDYTLDEEMVTDRELLSFAKTEGEARENWRKRIKYSLLVLRGQDKDEADKANKQDDESTEKSDDEPKKVAKKKDDPREQLRKRYKSFSRRMHQIDAEDVVERYITAITSSFDPHTSYLSKGTFENFLIQMGLELEGIGATLAVEDEGYTVIKNIVVGGAAASQGELKVEDKIVAVGQGEEDGSQADGELLGKHGPDFVDATGMKLDDVVGMIRGKAGTVVRLNVMSENAGELHTIKIVREKIKLEDSAARGAVFEQGKKANGEPNLIGVIELPSFYANMGGSDGGRSTTTDVRRILREFNEKNVDAVVLDLRLNGGGSLREAIDCTGLFIDLGPVVQVKNPYGDIEKLNDEDGGMSWEKPLVVLTSKFSASASEILAGAIQDYKRGLVIGDTTTHGKGTVQSLVNLNQIMYRSKNPPNEFGALKITTQQFYRPNGDSTQKRGVISDLVLPSISDNMKNIGEADLDYPVKFDRVPEASFQKYNFNRKEITSALASKSRLRIDASADFQKEERKISKYVEQRNRKTVSLNEEKFLARRKEMSADREDEKTMEKQMLPKNEIERDFYLDEILRITSDYMGMLGDKRLSKN
ncbi:MAG: carboxyl-terminal processing protease [Mariniblastus sp.]|jgi:carboxyl-terminal processing protease